MPAGVSAGGELGQEPCLADAGCSHDLNGAAVASVQLIERGVELLQLGRTPYEVVCELEDR